MLETPQALKYIKHKTKTETERCSTMTYIPKIVNSKPYKTCYLLTHLLTKRKSYVAALLWLRFIGLDLDLKCNCRSIWFI